jgi:hypothetical protein
VARPPLKKTRLGPRLEFDFSFFIDYEYLMEEKSVGELLQEWLIINNVSVTDPFFVGAINLAVENAIRQSKSCHEQHIPSISQIFHGPSLV